MDQPTVNGTPGTIEMTLPATAANGVAVKPYEAPRADPVANMRDLAARVDMVNDQADVVVGAQKVATAIEDAAELRWWRTQFATRFPAGQLPKPGTPLTGRRFSLSEGTPYPGPSFHVGVDLGEKEQVVLSLVEGGKVLGYAHIDVGAEMHALGKATSPYQALFRRIETAARNLVSLFAAPPDRILLCVGNCGKSTRAMPGQILWVCSECGATRKHDGPRAPGEVRTGDIWANTKTAKLMEVHSYVEGQDLWNVIVDGAQITTSVTSAFLTQPDHSLVAIRTKAGAVAPPPAAAVSDAPPPAPAGSVVETSPPCCRIGGEMHQLTRPCPFHDPVPSPAAYVGDYDTFDFLKP